MAPPRSAASRAATLTVSELTEQIQASLEDQFRDVWVAGEISGLRVPASGHMYFTLKDERSQLRAVMFRGYAGLLRFEPEDGLEVVVKGRVGMYPARGDLQLYAAYMEPLGLGGQLLALEQLKAALAAEGLFAQERKRPLPFFPRRIGVVTALGGAAVHDILVILHDRCRYTRVVIRPSRVQGAGAGIEIANGVQDLNDHGVVDVIIVGRGGGSREDLSAFNEEIVARAIAGSRIPVVAAVGHEVDLTIADLVADRRAPTPTAAAEMVVPRWAELHNQLAHSLQRLVAAMWRLLERRRTLVEHWGARVQDPTARIDVERRLIQAAASRLTQALRRYTQQSRSRMQELAAALNSLSPLAVLTRGYSLARTVPDGKVVTDAAAIRPGDRLRLTFARGEADARVEAVRE